MSAETRVFREKKTVTLMIKLYCREQHQQQELCETCETLNEYALKRIDYCRLLPDKPVCSICPVHCYKADFREQVRKVMRYSGPRMMLYHPWLAIMHLIDKALFKPEKIRG